MLTGTLINSLELNFISAFNNLLNSFTREKQLTIRNSC